MAQPERPQWHCKALHCPVAHAARPPSGTPPGGPVTGGAMGLLGCWRRTCEWRLSTEPCPEIRGNELRVE